MYTQAQVAPATPFHAICTFAAPTSNIDDTELSLVSMLIDVFPTQDAAWQACKQQSSHPAFVNAYVGWSICDK